ncbi:hypothetical protein SAMN04488543_3394 [Friedmanniella luteola]|uniref:Carboxypeptidase regulatory-like domain-containing protein n=1 Tax=Friedmanniella luteola TaxID=546871 RepID=A0A1H1YPU8_9ACTN|nr:hypothetical protein [Friedmanniella luteola]SDT23505.1 hypothetical protein SAMN04488543_3394 [Friedmanniella luteola]
MTAPDPHDDARLDALAAQPVDATDLAVLDALRGLLERVDPVPDGLVERIEFELTLDALQAEVATLTQVDLVGAGARTATEAVRTITFTSESVTTMVTLTPQEAGAVRVDGWAAPGAGVRVELLHAGGTLETRADEDGRFVFERVPVGLAKFVLHVPVGDGVATVLSPAVEL